MTPISVDRTMRVLEIVTLCRESADIMAEYGLHCFSCSIGGVETLEDGCRMHGFSDEQIDELVDDINQMIADTPQRSPMLIITASAARAIRDIAVKEDHEAEALRVIVDEQGGFCMEFTEEREEDEQEFWNEEESDVKIYASPLTLWRIGGSTIDYREGLFKLDLPEGENSCACTSQSCACH